MPDFKEILAKSYCDTIRDIFESNEISENLSVERRELELYNQLSQYQDKKSEIIQQWANTPIEALGSSTPLDLISNMTEFSEVFDLFLYMVEHTDEEIPFILIEKLKQFKGKAINTLVNLSFDCISNGNDILFIAAVSALGEFKLRDCVEPLIQLANELDIKERELEHVEEALKNTGECAIDPIMDKIGRIDKLGYKDMGKIEKMLLYVLASVSSNSKDERIYKILRNAFKSMDDKMTAVVSLNVYGDGRAVPMLRGYLQRNSSIPENLLYEIVGTIQSLGGRTDDFLNGFSAAKQ